MSRTPPIRSAACAEAGAIAAMIARGRLRRSAPFSCCGEGRGAGHALRRLPPAHPRIRRARNPHRRCRTAGASAPGFALVGAVAAASLRTGSAIAGGDFRVPCAGTEGGDGGRSGTSTRRRNRTGRARRRWPIDCAFVLGTGLGRPRRGHGQDSLHIPYARACPASQRGEVSGTPASSATARCMAARC